MDDQTPPTEPQSPPPPEPEPDPPRRRLERSKDDRMVSGVAGGIARYLGVDATLVRIVLVALAVFGGAGVLLYLAALLLMPDEGAPAPTLRGGEGGRTQALTVLGVIVLVGAAFAGLAVVGAVVGWILFPFAFLVLAGLFAWWIASGERPAGTPGQILKGAALGLALLTVCLLVAAGGAWAAGTGSGAVAAGIVIGGGAVLVAAAFARPARWLILPALALALSAGFVSATGIDFDGGVGDREYKPTSAANVRDKYELGIGELIVDLRAAHLPPGDRHIDVDDTVARRAPAGTPRVVLHGDLGVGMLDVHHDRGFEDGPRSGWRDDWEEFDEGGNAACVGGARAQVGGGNG